jgi:hypothetical protein
LRWRGAFANTLKERPVGNHDNLIALAERYHWTPDQIGDMDPDYVDELLIRMSAQADQEAVDDKRRKRGKGSRGSSSGTTIVDADLSEIE